MTTAREPPPQHQWPQRVYHLDGEREMRVIERAVVLSMYHTLKRIVQMCVQKRVSSPELHLRNSIHEYIKNSAGCRKPPMQTEQ